MEVEISPKHMSSKRKIKYSKSAWNIHEFEIWSGDLICRVVVLRMKDSLLVWVGGRDAQLNEVALGVPLAVGNGALATTLLGEEGNTSGLARRLTLALGRQVYVCCGKTFDRFTGPLVERGIVAEIKNRPDCF
ncbi:unnamed protein product, partial [Brenthis ino]